MWTTATTTYIRSVVLMGVCALCPMLCFGTDLLEQTASDELFVRRIAPILRDKCLPCHGQDPEIIEGGLDVRSRRGLLLGGDSGAASVDVDAPLQSPLWLAVQRSSDSWSAMPPKESEQLSSQQLDWMKEWLLDGAVWPNSDRIAEIENANLSTWESEDGVLVPTSGGLDQGWTNRRYPPENLWAYQPLKNVAVEAGVHPIDYLLSANKPDSVRFSERASRTELIRRATYDLLGLPPTPEELRAFLNDPEDDHEAFSRLIDRLLQSPHYGEKMAQHWLDVTRYADSSGFANDYEHGNAWRYRDYVVRAFNQDLPYDEFVKEQIAGDEIAPEDPEKIIATGFLRMGPWELTGMEVPKIARQRFLDDVTNSVGEVFLGQALQCARCHDHKFDPVPTRDYYAIQAVFSTTQLCSRPAGFLKEENVSNLDEEKYLRLKQAEYIEILKNLDSILLNNAKTWFQTRNLDSTQWDNEVEEVRKESLDQSQGGKRTNRLSSVFASVRNRLLEKGLSEETFPPKLVGFTPDQFGLERVARKGLERLGWELDRYQPLALAVYSGRTPTLRSVNAPLRLPAKRFEVGELEETAILLGGDPFSPGPAVEPSVLSVLDTLKHSPIPTAIEGRRRAFAEWLTDQQNPLTSRTMVNRIWGWHFGIPIAGNPNNLGGSGAKPTHPELLDWLAYTFIDRGWSIKAIHRLIMTSDAYCRSTFVAKQADGKSIDREGLESVYAVFKPRRLSAEELRDSMLKISGELNPLIGGIPVRPIINAEVALQPRQVMGTFASAWVPNPLPEQRNRRSLYILKLRGLMDPGLEVFNAPSPDFSCERREFSTVTPQVFSLFNSDNSLARSLALATRFQASQMSDGDIVEQLFLSCFSRKPTEQDLAMAMEHWRDMTEYHEGLVFSTAKLPRVILREAVEENTGERFTFSETLYGVEDFVPDTRLEDCNAKTRALADLCLVLFNSNEFIYVY